jgi:hypothetical protein
MIEEKTPDRYDLYLAKQRARSAARYAKLKDDPAFREKSKAAWRKWKEKQKTKAT